MLDAACAWKLCSLAFKLLARASKVLDHEAVATFLEISSNSMEAGEALHDRQRDVVRAAATRLQKKIERDSAEWLRSEIGSDPAERADALATIAALEDILPKCLPDGLSVAQANLNPERIAGLVVAKAGQADASFRERTFGGHLLHCLVQRAYEEAKRDRDFAAVIGIPVQEVLLNRTNQLVAGQVAMQQQLAELKAMFASSNGITRNDVARIAKVMLAGMTKTALGNPGYLQNMMIARTEPSQEMDTIALLRAQLAEARLDRESVLQFLDMSSALEQECRIGSSFGSRRIFAFSGDIVIAFIQGGGDYDRFSRPRSVEFLYRDVPAYLFSLHAERDTICLSASAYEELDRYLSYISHPVALLRLNSIVLAKRARLVIENSGFIALRDLISLKSEPDELSMDYLREKVRRTLGDRSTHRAGLSGTIDLAEIIAANRTRPNDGAYVSLVTSSLKLPRIDVCSDLHPRYDGSSVSPVQNAYGPAWRHYLEQSNTESDVTRLNFVPGACNLARKLLADPSAWRANGAGARSEEAARLLGSIQELLRIVDPFHVSIIVEMQHERKAIREETEDLLRDLLSGGRLIEQMLNEYIWHGVELRRMGEQQAGSQETCKQKTASQ